MDSDATQKPLTAAAATASSQEEEEEVNLSFSSSSVSESFSPVLSLLKRHFFVSKVVKIQKRKRKEGATRKLFSSPQQKQSFFVTNVSQQFFLPSVFCLFLFFCQELDSFFPSREVINSRNRIMEENWISTVTGSSLGRFCSFSGETSTPNEKFFRARFRPSLKFHFATDVAARKGK